MAKRVRVSDNGSNWYTLPGNKAELMNEAGEIVDTIFGQDFSSGQPGLIGWNIEANALYKGYSGYLAKLYKTGTPTSMTDEAMSVVSGKTYEVTADAKRCFDRNAALTFEDNSVAVDPSDIESIDHLFGRVTFTSGYSVSGPITVTGNYLPMANVGTAKEFTLTQTAQTIDETDFATAQANDGHRKFGYGLKTVALELKGIYSAGNNFKDLLISRSEIIVEVNPDGSGLSRCRGFFKPMQTGQSGDVGDLENESINFSLAVPDDEDVVLPFKWLHASGTTLNTAVQKCIAAWENKSLIEVQYLPDGTNGIGGDAVVTDLTLSGGLEVMNDFTVKLQGSEEYEAVP